METEKQASFSRKEKEPKFGEGFPLFSLQYFELLLPLWVLAGAGISAILTPHPVPSHICAACFLDYPLLLLILLGPLMAASLTRLCSAPGLQELSSSVLPSFS